MSELQNGNLPALHEDTDLEAPIFDEQSRFWTSLDTSTIEGKKKALRALGNSDFPASYMRDMPFHTTDVLVHEVQVANRETGEITQAVRCVLISSDGKTISFVSNGVLGSLRNIIQLFGRPPWDPPLKLFVRDVNTRGGYRTYNLVLAD